MKLTQLVVTAGLMFGGGSFAQQASAQEQTQPASPQAAEIQQELSKTLGGAAGSSQPFSPSVQRDGHSVVGTGNSYTFPYRDGTAKEFRVFKFDSVADADHYMVHGDLETTITGDFLFEQRGEWVAVVAGPGAEDAEGALEALRQTWNAVSKAHDTHSIPPVRTRSARVGAGQVIETEIDDQTFADYFQNLEYSDDPKLKTSSDDGVRRIHYGDESLHDYAQVTELSPADRSPFRSRADEGDFGRTRGLTLGGSSSSGGSTKGLTGLLTDN